MKAPHDRPAFCRCIDCSRWVLAQRCTAINAEGYQCGDYKRHGGPHTILTSTVFLAAAKRVAKAEATP